MFATLRQMPVNQGAHPNTEEDRGITYHMLEGRGKDGETGAETTPGVLEDIVPLSPRRSHSPNSCPLCLFSGGGKSHNPSY